MFNTFPQYEGGNIILNKELYFELKSEIAYLKGKNNSLYDDIDRLTSRNYSLESEVVDLNEKISILKNELTSLKNENNLLKDEINKQGKQI